MHRDAARGLAEEGHVFRIASERGDVPLHPLECGDLVHVGVVALELFRMLAAQCGEREEAEAPQTVVEGDQNDALPGELDPGRVGQEPLPNTKAPPWIHTMTGSFALGAAPAGRHTLTNRQSSDEFVAYRRGAAWEACLRAIRAELARITLSLPRGQGLGRTPAIGADRRGGIGNPLETGDIPFGHAAHDSGGGTNRRRRGRAALVPSCAALAEVRSAAANSQSATEDPRLLFPTSSLCMISPAIRQPIPCRSVVVEALAGHHSQRKLPAVSRSVAPAFRRATFGYGHRGRSRCADHSTGTSRLTPTALPAPLA